MSLTSICRRQRSINNKTAFTIAAPNRLRRDSRPRFSINHLDAKLIANPSSFNVVNLVPGENLGFHSHCIWEHVFQLGRISRYNDVEITFLEQSLYRGTIVLCKEHQLSLVSHCLDALATKPSDRHVAPLVKWTKFMKKYSTV